MSDLISIPEQSEKPITVLIVGSSSMDGGLYRQLAALASEMTRRAIVSHVVFGDARLNPELPRAEDLALWPGRSVHVEPLVKCANERDRYAYEPPPWSADYRNKHKRGRR